MFHCGINQTFRRLRKTQILIMYPSIIKIVLRFSLLIQIQKTVSSISLNSLNITQGYLKSCIQLLAIFFLMNYIFQCFFGNLQYTSHYTLVKSLFGLAFEKDCSFHIKYVSSTVLSMIKDDSKFIADWNSIDMILITGHVMALVMAFLLMLRYDVVIAAIIFLFILSYFVVAHFISKKTSNKTYDLRVFNTELNQRMVDYLGGVKDIKRYKEESFFQKRLSDFIDGNTYKHSKNVSQYYSVFTSTYAMPTVVLPILTILVGAILTLNDQYTIGELIVTYVLVGNPQEPVQVIPDYLNQRRQALKIQNKIMPILEDNSISYAHKKLGAFQGFSFHSDACVFEDGKVILKDIDFIIQKGGSVITKGESGKGKSGLLNLISRFCGTDGQAVSMEYNGIPVETIAPDVYYQHVLQGQQLSYILRDTVQENMTLGEVVDEEALKEVIHTVCMGEFVSMKGLDYLLKQGGRNTSDGQKQRVGLARVLVRRPDILVLDRPTSTLDPELINMITERTVKYCERYQVALVLVSHNDSFEKYYQKAETGQVEVIRV